MIIILIAFLHAELTSEHSKHKNDNGKSTCNKTVEHLDIQKLLENCKDVLIGIGSYTLYCYTSLP